jgi:hypothetical protein
MIFFDNPETVGQSYTTQLNQSGFGKYWSYNILKQATEDFNILTTFKNHFLEWSIPSLSILSNVGKSFFTAYGDEDLNFAEETFKGLTRSVGAFKILKPIANVYFESE